MKIRTHLSHEIAPVFGCDEVVWFHCSTDQYGRHRRLKARRGRELGDLKSPLAGVTPGKSAFRVNANKHSIHDPSCTTFTPIPLFSSSLTLTF